MSDDDLISKTIDLRTEPTVWPKRYWSLGADLKPIGVDVHQDGHLVMDRPALCQVCKRPTIVGAQTTDPLVHEPDADLGIVDGRPILRIRHLRCHLRVKPEDRYPYGRRIG